MKSAWARLGTEFLYSNKVLVGAMDCTTEDNMETCEKYDVENFPTISIFDEGRIETYVGERSFMAFKDFADGQLGPGCGSKTRELCSGIQLQRLETLEALGQEEIEDRIHAGETVILEAITQFGVEKEIIEGQIEELERERDRKVSKLTRELENLKMMTLTEDIEQ